MNKRDLKADLEAIRGGATLFGDPNPGVNTQYELYEVAEHAIERAIKAEALSRELVEALEIACEGMYVNIPNIRMARATLAKAKEVLGG